MSEHRINLITAYIEAAGETPANAVRALNAELGTSYDTNRLGQWRRGERPTPGVVQRAMRRTVLEHRLGADTADALAPCLEVPDPLIKYARENPEDALIRAYNRKPPRIEFS